MIQAENEATMSVDDVWHWAPPLDWPSLHIVYDDDGDCVNRSR
jgi:hypothetical protein